MILAGIKCVSPSNLWGGRSCSLFCHPGGRFPFPSSPRKRESAPSLPSFPRKRESIEDTAEVDPRLRGDDGSGVAAGIQLGHPTSLPSFPRKRESAPSL